MVHIYFYKCTSEKNRIDKSSDMTLIPYQSGQDAWLGEFKEDTSIINPVFTVKVASSSVTDYDFNNCNYCYIDELKRYYFIKDIVIIAQGTFRIFCHVDVLMSNKADIQSSGSLCVISRSETLFNAKQPCNVGTILNQYNYRMYCLTHYTSGRNPFSKSIVMSVVNTY